MKTRSPSARGSLIKPRTARLAAAGFLLLGILLGIFSAPQFADRALAKIGIGRFFTLSGKKTDIPYRLGLDIRGGARLIYQADVAHVPSADQQDSLASVRDVIERRVNLFGVAEPLVQVEKSGGDWRLIVELAGIKDINSAIRLIGETPFLEFRTERPEAERDQILEAQKKGERPLDDPYFAPTALTGRYIKNASVSFDQNTFQPMVNLEFTGDGVRMFADLTRENIGKRVAIYLDGSLLSAPQVQNEITEGRAQISGSFTPQSARELAGRMNAGALPVPIKLIAQQSVGATLGEESLAQSMYAGFIGFLAVALFMILWYRLPGFVAVIALILYVGIVLAVFKLIPVTLTIAGIAGFILSIGMAVDANILIFERMKEELRAGKPFEEAIREGFGRAWTSIRDSNASSVITAAVLYFFGSSVVRGFALTLAIGVGVSMFSAISITRTLLLAVSGKRLQKAKFIFMSGFTR